LRSSSDLNDGDWRKVDLIMDQWDGTTMDISLLRPKTWLNTHNIYRAGDKLWLSMPEQNIQGYATVQSLAHYRFQKIPESDKTEAAKCPLKLWICGRLLPFGKSSMTLNQVLFLHSLAPQFHHCVPVYRI